MRFTSVAVAMGMLAGCGRPSIFADTPQPTNGECVRGESASNTSEVTFAELVANGRSYHGRRVRIRGFLELKFEETMVYDIQQSCDQMPVGIRTNTIWLNVPPYAHLQRACGGRHAFVEGVYDTNEHGVGPSTGGLNDVNFIRSAGPVCANMAR